MWTPCRQVLFVVVDVGADNSHVLQYFGVKAEEAPTLRFINMETTKKYTPADGGPLTAASVTAFCNAVLGGKVKVRAGSSTRGVGWEQAEQVEGEIPGKAPCPAFPSPIS